MTLEDIYFISQIVAAAAIVASLIFVGLQLRQSDKTQRAQMQMVRAQRGMDLTLAMCEPYLLPMLEKLYGGRTDLTSSERAQLSNVIRTFAHQASDAEWQHKAKLLDGETLDTATRPLMNMMACPAARAMWRISRANYSQHMSAMIDRLVEARPVGGSVDLDARWEAAVAELLNPQRPSNEQPGVGNWDT